MTERKHPNAICEECPLADDSGAAYAPGSGPASADIVILGEAPGHAEAKQGTPFVGPSGKLLDTVLAYHGIDRRKVYVDNVVACRPADNRTPTKKEVQCCWPRAEVEIRRRQPTKIVALGNIAGQTILDTSVGITSLRVGPPKRSEAFNADVIATFHPAYCLRAHIHFPTLVNDIGKFKSPPSTWQPPHWKLFDDETAALAIDELNLKFDEIVVDIETAADKEEGYDHPDHYEMLCIGFCYAPGKAIVIGGEALKHARVKLALRRLFQNPKKRWICHNGKYDIAGLLKWGMLVDGLWFDTMLASYALDERKGIHGLKYHAVETLGAPKYDDVLDKYVKVPGIKGKDFSLAPKHILYEYNAYDVHCTWQLKDIFIERLEKEGLRHLHDRLVFYSPALMKAEMEGVFIDKEYLDKLTDIYLEELEEIEGGLKPWVKNPRSPKQVKEALYALGLKVASTNQDTLEHLQDKLDPESEANDFISRLLVHRRTQKLYGTYIKGARIRLYQGRLHPTYMLHGTDTGRIACRNPNLQNVPRESKIRRLYIPQYGYVYIQADYGQIELRVAAVQSKDRYLYEVLNDPTRDIFDEIGENLYGSAAVGPKRKELRIRTKAYVYGVNYGREAYSIAQEFRISERDAQKGMDGYFEMVPDFVAWREEIMEKAIDPNVTLESLFGRKHRVYLITAQNKKDIIKESLAFMCQSPANDVALTAARHLSITHGLHFRIPVHDSILAEEKEEEAEEKAALMVKVMSETATEMLGGSIPFPVEVNYGASWGDV